MSAWKEAGIPEEVIDNLRRERLWQAGMTPTVLIL